MRRASLLKVADIELGRFTNYRARGQLPFSDHSEEDAGKYQNFSLLNAFQLRLMLDLTENGGLDIENTTMIIRYVNPLYFRTHPLDAKPEETKKDQWIAVGYYWGEFDIGQLETGAIAAVGTLATVSKNLESQYNKIRGNNPPLHRVFMANVTGAASFVRTRAKMLGLPEADDFTPIWSPLSGNLTALRAKVMRQISNSYD